MTQRKFSVKELEKIQISEIWQEDLEYGNSVSGFIEFIKDEPKKVKEILKEK